MTIQLLQLLTGENVKFFDWAFEKLKLFSHLLIERVSSILKNIRKFVRIHSRFKILY